jgi:26S proteasome regulatory subunit T5
VKISRKQQQQQNFHSLNHFYLILAQIYIAQILRIHSRAMTYAKDGVHAVNFEEIARSTEDFNGAMLKAVCVEAGMLALRNERTSLTHEDYNEGVAVVQSKKKTALQYYA